MTDLAVCEGLAVMFQKRWSGFVLLTLHFKETSGCFVTARLNRYSRQAACPTPTLSKQSPALTEPSVHRPMAHHGTVKYGGEGGRGAVSDTVNTGAVCEWLMLFMPFLWCIGLASWNVQRCSCRSVGDVVTVQSSWTPATSKCQILVSALSRFDLSKTCGR